MASLHDSVDLTDKFELPKGWEEDVFRYCTLFNIDVQGKVFEGTVGHIERLQSLSEACGGWIVFDGDKEETFFPLDHWKKIYRDRAHQ